MIVYTAQFLPQEYESFSAMDSIQNSKDFGDFIRSLDFILESYNLGGVFRNEANPFFIVVIHSHAVENLSSEYYYKDFISDVENWPEEKRKTLETMIEKVEIEKKDMLFYFLDV